jgi:hypothetical protein
MKVTARPRRLAVIAVVGIAVLLPAAILSSGDDSVTRPDELLQLVSSQALYPTALDRADIPIAQRTTDDSFFRYKYSADRRAEFEVVSKRAISIFVPAAGVEVYGPTGWEMASQENRGEIWHLIAASPRDVCFERPHFGLWRAFVRYHAPMRGVKCLRWRIRRAWAQGSLSGWTSFLADSKEYILYSEVFDAQTRRAANAGRAPGFQSDAVGPAWLRFPFAEKRRGVVRPD